MTTLLDAVRRHAEVHADREGIAPTPIQGVFAVRATATGDLKHDISRPLLCLVVQGAKRVTMGTQSFDFSDGDSLLITADVPLKQYILHLNDLAPAEGKFLIADLDDRRVLVQPSRADAIRAEIERYQQSTQYVAPTTMTKQ